MTTIEEIIGEKIEIMLSEGPKGIDEAKTLYRSVKRYTDKRMRDLVLSSIRDEIKRYEDHLNALGDEDKFDGWCR